MTAPILLLLSTLTATPIASSLEAAAVAFERNDAAGFYKAMAVVAGGVSRDPEAVSAFDGSRAAEGKPLLGEMLFRMRATLAAAGGQFLRPRPTPFEAVLLLPELNDAVSEVVKVVEAFPTMGAELPVPTELEAFDSQFEELKNAQNRCGLSRDMTSLGAQLQKLARRQRSLTDEQRAALTADLKTLSERLAELHELAKAREVDLRLERAALAAKVLSDPAQAENNKLRLLASHSLDRDGAMLLALTQSKSWEAIAGNLKYSAATAVASEMKDHIDSLITQGRTAAGSDWVVAQLLFTGIDYWIRGKYGRSQMVRGLVEPPDTRYQTVYVPSPLDERQQSYAPSRRHYYTWVWEERRMVIRTKFNISPTRPGAPKPKSVPAPTAGGAKATPLPVAKAPRGYYQPLAPRNPNAGGGGGGSVQAGSNWNVMQIPYGHQYGPIDRPYSWSVKDVYKAYGWKPPSGMPLNRTSKPKVYKIATATSERYIPPQDPRLVYRVVGHDEYIDALACFDALAKLASPAQRQAVDELISEREELTVDTNHSKGHASTLAEPNFPQQQRGLVWLTALARVEIAAARIGFAEQMDALVAIASKYDLEAFRHMVRDGLRSHYHALRGDATINQVLTSGTSPQVLAYLRRTYLTMAFLDATIALHQGVLSPQQLSQLAAWRMELQNLEESLVDRLKSAPA